MTSRSSTPTIFNTVNMQQAYTNAAPWSTEQRYWHGNRRSRPAQRAASAVLQLYAQRFSQLAHGLELPVYQALDDVQLAVSIPGSKDTLALVAREPDIEADRLQVLDDDVGV